jgi:hypothetical protein
MMTSKIAISAVLMSVTIPAAHAQIADPVDSILSCREIVSVEARLACFDAAAGTLATAREAGDIVTVTREDVEAVERDSFGFSMPSLPRFRLPIFAGRAAAEAQATENVHAALEGVTSAATHDSTTPDPAVVADAGTTNPAASAPTPAAPAASTAAPAIPAPARSTPANPTPNVPESPNEDVQIIERDDDGGVFMVEMAIRGTRRVGYNTTVFYMENGQVWRQSDTTAVNVPNGDEGNVAQIRQGAMGSYLLRINGRGRAIRVRRER